MMRSGALLLASVSLAACSRGPEPVPAAPRAPQSPLEWSAEAPGGRFAIQQAAAGRGCLLTAVEGGVTRWTSDTCAGSREDLHFVSPDGERLLVLHPLPEGVRGKDWSEAVVARILVRGKEERRFVGAELVAAASISDMSRTYSWVKGVGSAGGTAPRYADGGGAVLLDVADGAQLRLGFDGTGAPGRSAALIAARTVGAGPVAPRGGPSRDADDTTTWRWEDAEGAVHFTSWAQVPAERRRKAEPVTASLGSTTGGGSPRAATRLSSGFPRDRYPARLPSFDERPANPGPRLNGLTDSERHAQERERAEAERAKQANEAELWRAQRDRIDMLERARLMGWDRGAPPPPLPNYQ